MKLEWVRVLWAVGVAASTAALVLFGLRQLSSHLRLLDHPGGRHRHRAPTPRIGGIAFAAGIAAGTYTYGFVTFRGWSYPEDAVLAGLLCMALGLLDDLLRDRFKPLWKLLGQAAVSLAAAWMLKGPFSMAERGIVAAAVLAAMNAYNFFDHANGLLLVALAVPMSLPSLSGEMVTPTLAAGSVVLLANLGGLAFGGDAMSHGFAGFVAISCFDRFAHQSLGFDLLQLAALSSIVLLDMAVVIMLRISEDTPPWRSTPVHLSDRFESRGWPRSVGFLGVAAWAVTTRLFVPVVDAHGIVQSYRWPLSLAAAATVVALSFVRLRRVPLRSAAGE